MMLMTPSVPATSISRRSRVPSKTLMLALFHAKQVIPVRKSKKFVKPQSRTFTIVNNYFTAKVIGCVIMQ